MTDSFLILFFYLVGGFELSLPVWFLPNETVTKPLIFLFYLLITYFIVLNVFLAVILDSYTML